MVIIVYYKGGQVDVREKYFLWGMRNADACEFKILSELWDAGTSLSTGKRRKRERKLSAWFIWGCSIKKRKKLSAKIASMPAEVKKIVIGIAGAVIALVVIIFVFTRSTVIDLNDYVVVEFNGYDGYGTAVCSFDRDSFYADYSEIIEKSEDMSALLYADYIGYEDEQILYGLYIYDTYSLDITENLSNGDKVTLSWEIDDSDDNQVENYFNIKLKHSETTFKVENLSEVESVNIFDGINLIYTGASPVGTAILENNSTIENIADLPSDYFKLSKETGLSNGDVITVTLSEEAVLGLEKNFGIKPTSLEQEYTVEGLGEYITQLSNVSDDLLSDLQDVSEKNIKEAVVDKGSTVIALNYLGMYLFYNTSYETQSIENHYTKLFVVYEVNIANDYEDDFTFYTYVEFYDPIMSADGVVYVEDLEDHELCNHEFGHDTYTTGIRLYGMYSKYNGYESLSELEKDLVANEGGYQYDENVDESSFSDDITGTEETSTTNNSDEYLCSYSSERLITDSDIETLKAGDYGDLPGDRNWAQMMINEIYARHGYYFDTDEVRNYFQEKSWYSEIDQYESDQDAVCSEMTQIEKDNIEKLKEYI